MHEGWRACPPDAAVLRVEHAPPHMYPQLMLSSEDGVPHECAVAMRIHKGATVMLVATITPDTSKSGALQSSACLTLFCLTDAFTHSQSSGPVLDMLSPAG